MTHKVLNANMKVSVAAANSLSAKFAAARMSAINYGTSLKLVSGQTTTWAAVSVVAINTVKAAWTALLARLGPVLFAFGLFEGLVWTIGYLTGMGDRLKQVEKNAMRSAESLEAFEKQVKGLNRSLIATNQTADKFNDQFFNKTELEKQRILVAETQKKMIEERAGFTKDLTLKEQAAIQVRLDNLQKEYDERTAKLIEYQKKIEALNTKHEANIAKGAARLADQEAIIVKRANIADFLAAAKSYQDLLNQQTAFLKTKEQAVDKSNERLLQAEKDFGQASLMAAQELELQKFSLVESNLSAMERIQDSYQKKMIDMDATEIERVEQKFKELRDFETKRIENERKNAIERLRIAYASTASAVSGTGVGGTSVPGFDSALVQQSVKLKVAEDKYLESLKNTNLTHEQRNSILQDYRGELVSQKNTFDKLQSSYNIPGYEKFGEFISNTSQSIGAQITKIDESANAYSVYNDGLKTTEQLTKKINEGANNATIAMADQTLQQEFMEIAAIKYKQILKALGQEYKDIANAVLKYKNEEGDMGGALARNIQLQQNILDIQNKYRNSSQTLGGAIKNNDWITEASRYLNEQ